MTEKKYIDLESDLHDQLMIEFRNYFIANEKWETGTSDMAGIKARNALGQIRIIARKRRMEIQKHRKARKQVKKSLERKKPNE